MKEFFPEIDIRDQEVDAIARGLYAVAHADGEVHPGELALIAEFYASCTSNPADFAALARASDIEAEDLAGLITRDEVRILFVKTALLMSHADGQYGEGEAACIEKFAAAMGMDKDAVAEIDSQVKDFLMSQLAHLSNVDALVEVAQELKL
ncbi:TerB family tellurite resistance protein [Haliangium ochraceum]|uniref:Co-chaperone DjlA N-terminal domain-containing protein n=1 Tax=Haliangium ochraceum (strain DSM 14365 / JCM 11303 / SMP-2) TaxID=502025 RepID=D0LVK9_HALO1|nr:TerB family tellurite resistance protein [Haliangium ochraceum]ACY17570.1 conserved hypothetical protein [Haliangium ochraceum DSM 14365]